MTRLASHEDKHSISLELTFYVGSYTDHGGKGIYVCGMDSETGAIRLKSVKGGVVNPSFLTIDHSNCFLYSVSETSSQNEMDGGFVSAFSIDARTSKLEFLNRQPSEGAYPCYLCLDKDGRHVLVSNYSSGNVAVLPVGKDGDLGRALQVVQHYGSGADQVRQKRPHAHSVMLDDTNNFAFVADLGIDKIMIYKFDANAGRLEPDGVPSVEVAAGAGPRHLCFHPNGKMAFVINELNSTITAFHYDGKTGNLSELRTVSTLPPTFSGENACADIQVHPSGKFLYGSNRGHDTIVVFEIEESCKDLHVVQYQRTEGKTPRNFVIDPAGRFLVVANQGSDTVVAFAIDSETGKLTPTGQAVEIPVPVCPKFTFLNH